MYKHSTGIILGHLQHRHINWCNTKLVVTIVYIIVVCYIPVAQLIYLTWYTTCSTEMSYPSILIDSFCMDCALPISYQLHNILLSKQVNELLMHKFKTSRAYLFLFVCITHHQGPVSAYFTVFAAPYLPIHTTKIEKADEVYARNIGTHLLKVMLDSIGCKNRNALIRAWMSREYPKSTCSLHD